MDDATHRESEVGVEVVYNVIHLITSPSQQVLTQLAATVIVRARLIPRLFRRQTP